MNKIPHPKLNIKQITHRRYCINNIKISISVMYSIINQYYRNDKNDQFLLKYFYRKKLKERLSLLTFIEENEVNKINEEYFFGQKTVKIDFSNFILFLYTLNIHYNEVPKLFTLIIKDHEKQESFTKMRQALEKASQNKTHNNMLIIDYDSKLKY